METRAKQVVGAHGYQVDQYSGQPGKFRDPSEVYARENDAHQALGKTPRQTISQDAQLRNQQQLLAQRVQQASQLPQLYSAYQASSNKSTFNRFGESSKGPINRQIHLKQLEQQQIQDQHMNTDRNHSAAPNDHDDLHKLNRLKKPRNSLSNAMDALKFNQGAMSGQNKLMMSGEDDEETAVNFASDRNHYVPQQQPSVTAPAGPRSGVIQHQFQQHQPIMSSDETEGEEDIEREGATATGEVKAMESEVLISNQFQSKFQQSNASSNDEYGSKSFNKLQQSSYNESSQVSDVYGKSSSFKNMNVAVSQRERNSSNRPSSQWTRQQPPYTHKRAVSDNLNRSANNSTSKEYRQNASSPLSSSKMTTTQKILRKGLGTSDSNRDISPFTKAAKAQEEHFKKQSELIQKLSQQTYAPISYNAAQNYRSDKSSSSASRLKKSSSKSSKKMGNDSKQTSNNNFEYPYANTVARGNKRAGIFSYDVIDEEQSQEAKESMVSKSNTDQRRMNTLMSQREQMEQVVAAAKNVINSDYGNDFTQSQTSDIVEQDDEFEIPQSPERTKRNNLRQINDNMAMNRGTIKKSDSKSFANNKNPLGISVSTLQGSGMTAPIRQAQSFMSRDSRQYQTINATHGQSDQMGYNFSKSFVGAHSSHQSKADLSQQNQTISSRVMDKFRTIAPTTETNSFKHIAETQGSIDDEPRPMKTGVVYRNEGPSDTSSVRTLRSYQANNGAVIGFNHPASASSKRIQQPYTRPLKETLSPNMSMKHNKFAIGVTPTMERYQKLIGSSQVKQQNFMANDHGFGTQRENDITPTSSRKEDVVGYFQRNSPRHDKIQMHKHNGESDEPLSADNFNLINRPSDEFASKRMSIAEATAKAKIVQGLSPVRGNFSSNTSPQVRRLHGTEEAAGKGISLITVTKIPQQQALFTGDSEVKTQRTSIVAPTPQLKNLDDVNRRQSKLQKVLGLNPQSKPQSLNSDYIQDQRVNLDPLTPKEQSDAQMRSSFSPAGPSTTRHASDDKIASGLQSSASQSLRYGAYAQQARPRVNPSAIGLDSNRIQINLYNFEQDNTNTLTTKHSAGNLEVNHRFVSQASAGHIKERMPTGESSNTADIEAKIEQFGLEQFRLGQQKLEQELRAKENQIQLDYDQKLQQLQNQIQKEQDEKQKLAEEAERRAQEQAQEIKEQLRRELENEMREKMRELDEQHQRENEHLKKQIAIIQGSYQDMQTNLLRNEQIRKVQQQQIIHLKGNMRVFARVKPNKITAPELQQAVGEDESVALGGVNIFDHSQFEPNLISFPQLMEDAEGKVVKVAHQSLELHMPRVGGGIHAATVFNFDHVFLPNSSQAELFEEIKPFVQTALDGENTCIFAYGQTGSGKTYTMEGPSKPGEEGPVLFDQATMKPFIFSGILPRIAIFIQHEIDRYRRQFHQEIFIEVSALEIYCDHIRDLLGQASDPTKQRYVEIRNAGNNKVQCLGQTWVRVSSPAEFLNQINESAKKRVFRDNGINPHSSRSHHVFQIRVNSYDKLGKPCQSMLNVVDLAGSERRVGTLNVFSSQHDDEYYSTTTGGLRTKKKRGSKAPNKKETASVQNRFQLDFKRPSGVSATSNLSLNPPLSQTSNQRTQPSIIQDQQGSREPQSFNQKFVSTNPSSLGKTEKGKRASVFTTHKKSFMGGAGQSTIQKVGTSSSRQLKIQGPENLRHSVSQQTLGAPTTGTATQSLLEQVPKTYDLETESKFINKNLTTLGRVLAILANRKLQGKMAPPYRECKLTRLLQSSLQHDKCKTLMIVNVCSSMKNATATKESLEFASKAMTAF